MKRRKGADTGNPHLQTTREGDSETSVCVEVCSTLTQPFLHDKKEEN